MSKKASVTLSVVANADNAVLNPDPVNCSVPVNLWHLPKEAIFPAQEMNFARNWNSKLNCRFFSTIRLSSQKWTSGQYYRVNLNREFLFRAKIIDKITTKLNQLKPFTAALDTGMPLAETQQFLFEQYKDHVSDWEKQTLDVLLVENIEYNL